MASAACRETTDNAPARQAAVRRGRNLEYLTLGWNVCEAGVAIVAGILAGSIALLGFGLDSLIESSSGGILLWRLSAGPEGESREQLALKLVGWSFLVLAAYVGFDGVKALVTQQAPETSVTGIVMASLSVLVMPVLARAKRRVAGILQSRALRADSRQTDLCAWLSAILLLGLILNALFHWWWADPVAALIMVPIIGREGLEALRGESCCSGCHG